ncbi:Ubiquitin carboxyl-terminal hydrolase 7, partial [Linum grandiflorum]
MAFIFEERSKSLKCAHQLFDKSPMSNLSILEFISGASKIAPTKFSGSKEVVPLYIQKQAIGSSSAEDQGCTKDYSRQKIMLNDGLLKDDVDWTTIGAKQSQMLMMMETSNETVNTLEKGYVFVDLSEFEQVAVVGYTAGLHNLGNTSYMIS